MRSYKTFVELPHLEQQEFQDCCERRRYNRKEFNVISNEANDRYRTVTVSHQGKERHYMACEDKNWLADFDTDLAAGYFDLT
jgi:hypothetical protein